MPRPGRAFFMAGSNHNKPLTRNPFCLYSQVMNDDTDPGSLMTEAETALQRGDGPAALAALNAVLARDPDHEEALQRLAELAHGAGRSDVALGYLNRLCTARPDRAHYWFQLGSLLGEMGQREAGDKAILHALTLDPRHPGALINSGNRLKERGALEEAADHYRTALEVKPDLVEVQSNLASVLSAQGLHEAAAALYERIAEAAPDLHIAQSNRLMNLNYMAETSPAEVFAAHKAWGARFPDRQAASTDPDPDRPLHIGFLSPDFRSHPVFWFLHALMANLDRSRCRITCFSNLAREDEKTGVIRGLSDGWHRVDRLADQDLAALIEREGIDILIDLAGHTANNRLPVMALRPAPVQMTWLGYPNTTGLTQVDYRIVDAITDPPGAEEIHTEKLLRLAPGFLCFSPPRDAPPVGPLPMMEAGFCTFASFNNLAKVTRDVVSTWAEILTGVPGSKLLIKARSLDDPGTRERYLDWFREDGIASGRLILKGRLPGAWDHLNLYNQVDIALDTFPYNGTTTTCEALWMGVPVLALRGDRHAACVGASLLENIGLSENITKSKQDYVAKAIQLAADAPALALRRTGLRARMAASPLTDGPAFARTMQAAWREAWRNHCTAPIPTAGNQKAG